MSLFSAFKSPATAISIGALVVACSGGAFAAGQSTAPQLRTVIVHSARGVAACPSGYQLTGGGYAETLPGKSFNKNTQLSGRVIESVPAIGTPGLRA